MFSNSFIQDLIKFRNNSRLVLTTCSLTCLASLSIATLTPKGINKLSITFIGLMNAVVGVAVSRLEDDLTLRLGDLQLTSRATSKELLAEYLKDSKFSVTVPTQSITEQDVITDIVGYWKQQEKHLAVVGGTGDGKSYTIKLFVSALQNEYSIVAYDVDFAKDDYPDYVNVKYHYEEIEVSFTKDMEELEKRIGERREQGKNYNPEKKLTIGEEMPALADECESLGLWMRKLSKRGRKAGLFIAAIAQNDTAENFALKGDASILKSNFCLLYLGKKAKERAKQLKNNALVEWLDGTSKGRGLIDDKPVIIQASGFYNPSSALPNEEIKDTKKPPGSIEEVAEVGLEAAQLSEENKLKYAKILRAEGHSKTKIIKLMWGVEGGGKFTELSKLLDQ